VRLAKACKQAAAGKTRTEGIVRGFDDGTPLWPPAMAAVLYLPSITLNPRLALQNVATVPRTLYSLQKPLDLFELPPSCQLFDGCGVSVLFPTSVMREWDWEMAAGAVPAASPPFHRAAVNQGLNVFDVAFGVKAAFDNPVHIRNNSDSDATPSYFEPYQEETFQFSQFVNGNPEEESFNLANPSPDSAISPLCLLDFGISQLPSQIEEYIHDYSPPSALGGDADPDIDLVNVLSYSPAHQGEVFTSSKNIFPSDTTYKNDTASPPAADVTKVSEKPVQTQDPQTRRYRKRNRKIKSVEQEEQQRASFLNRNRLAAGKCRQTKKAWVAALQSQVEGLQREKVRLLMELEPLLTEAEELRSLINIAATCTTCLPGEAVNIAMSMQGLIGSGEAEMTMVPIVMQE
jgi:hypothetical protein